MSPKLSDKPKAATAENEEARAEARSSIRSEAARRATAASREIAAASALARASLEPEQSPEAPIEPPSRLDSILETIADQGKFEVSRHSPNGLKARVGIFPIGDYPQKMEEIASKYKGGTFTITFKDSHGRIRGQDTQTFDALAYSEASPATPAAPAPDATASALERIMERMEARDAEARRDSSEARERQFEMQMKMMELIVAKSSTTPATNSAEIIDAIKLGQSMAAPANNPMESMKGIIEAMSMLREGSEQMAPQSPWAVALEKGLEVLTPIVAVLASKVAPLGGTRAPTTDAPTHRKAIEGGGLPPLRVGGVSASPASAAPLAAPAPASPNGEAAGAATPLDPKLVAYAGQLLSAAQNTVRPSIVAQLVVDSVTEDAVDEFESMIQDPKIVETLVIHEPRLALHSAWLNLVLSEMREKFDEAWPEAVEAPAPIDAAPVPADAPAAPAADPTPPDGANA